MSIMLQKLMPYRLCFVRSRTVSTSTSVLYRRRQNPDPGISHRRRIFDKDDEMRNKIEDEEDIASLETDFSNLDQSYGEFKRERDARKSLTWKKITAKKFFSDAKAPNMLTWAERLQIRKLHEENPEEWNLDALADSFPATREVISKILKAKWVPDTLERMQQHDDTVRENWKRLAAGKLDADPVLIEHLEKFLDRREDYLASLSSDDFASFINKREPTYRWNNGKMSSILESYERKLNLIEENQKRLSGRNHYDEFSDSSERKRSPESTGLATSMAYKIPEGSAMDSGSVEKNYISKKPFVSNKKLPINERLANLAGYSLNPGADVLSPDQLLQPCGSDPGNRKLYDSFEQKSVNINSNDEKSQFKIEQFENLKESKTKEKVSESDTVDIKTNRNSYLFNEEGSITYDKFKPTKTTLNQEIRTKSTIDDVKSMESSEEEVRYDNENHNSVVFSDSCVTVEDTFHKADVEKSAESSGTEQLVINQTPIKYDEEWEKQQLDKEIHSIEGTCFWNSGSMQASDIQISTSSSNLQKDSPPEYKFIDKINIPQEHRGKGLTFRVNDCFYDDDGEFLYRVPGLRSE